MVVQKIVFVFIFTLDTSPLRLFIRLSPENRMWYFAVKQSMQCLEPLPRILESILLLFWSHIKLDSSVAFHSFSYLKEVLSLYSLIYYIVLHSLIYYIHNCFCGV